MVTAVTNTRRNTRNVRRVYGSRVSYEPGRCSNFSPFVRFVCKGRRDISVSTGRYSTGVTNNGETTRTSPDWKIHCRRRPSRNTLICRRRSRVSNVVSQKREKKTGDRSLGRRVYLYSFGTFAARSRRRRNLNVLRGFSITSIPRSSNNGAHFTIFRLFVNPVFP